MAWGGAVPRAGHYLPHRPYQIRAGHSSAPWNKEALRTRLGCGTWGRAPSGAFHPGGRGHGVGEPLPPTPTKEVSLCWGHPPVWGAGPVPSTRAHRLTSLGHFLLQPFPPGPQLHPFHGAWRPPTPGPAPISLPGIFSPSHTSSQFLSVSCTSHSLRICSQ